MKNTLILSVLAYVHFCPPIQNPIFNSSTLHPDLAGIVKKHNRLIRSRISLN